MEETGVSTITSAMRDNIVRMETRTFQRVNIIQLVWHPKGCQGQLAVAS